MLHKRRTKKRRFRAYFDAPTKNELQKFLKLLKQEHLVTKLGNNGSRIQIFDIEISPSSFRRFQDALPKHIVVAYELHEPKKC